jgi:hypothetical protein
MLNKRQQKIGNKRLNILKEQLISQGLNWNKVLCLMGGNCALQKKVHKYEKTTECESQLTGAFILWLKLGTITENQFKELLKIME